ncbi:hydroxylysine kinase-like [Petromyzon marinus]|uniref:hydroxylysine kinase-like n=1 Tax=Petromyzon marinus TaxID=7757 RepID=UPI003F6FE826
MQAAPQDDGREHEKPCLSESRVAELVERLYGVSVAGVSPLASYVDQNYRVLARDGRQFVLKVTNTRDSQRPQLLEVQMAMMRFLRERGFPMEEVVDNVSGKIMSLESIDCGEGEKEFNVRLLTYLPGVPLSRVLADGSLYYQVGKLAASIHQALQQFEHPFLHSLQRDNFIWNLSNTHLLEPYLFTLDGDPNQGLVREVIAKFREEIQPNLHKFTRCTLASQLHPGRSSMPQGARGASGHRRGLEATTGAAYVCTLNFFRIIHGDFNDENILVQEVAAGSEQQQQQGPKSAEGAPRHRVSGIVDLNSMMFGYHVYDLAMAIMYMMVESGEAMEAGGHVLAGYESVQALSEDERFCQSLVMARYTILRYPQNADYLLITARTGWVKLRELWTRGLEDMQRLWSDVAARYRN